MIPIKYKKKIRYTFESVFGEKTKNDQIDIQQKPTNKPTILLYGITSWEYRFQRSQHIASGLAKKGWQVIYIEPDFLVTSNKSTPPYSLNQISTNLYVSKLASNRNLFIYDQLPDQHQLDLIRISLSRLLSAYSVKQVVNIVTHPFWHFISKPYIYDCMDYHAGFKENSLDILQLEPELMQHAEKVIVTSDFLKREALKNITISKIIVIPNAGDYAHFSNNSTKSVNALPVMGYIGAVNQWIDTDFIQLLAQAGFEIHMAGRVENQKIAMLSRKFTNIHLLGETDYKDLPNILSDMDICLIPFQINELTKATHPVKVYEYFATGKPVISSRLPELEPFAKLVYFYDKITSIKDIVTDIQKEPTQLRLERIEVARQNDWQHRINQFDEILKGLI